MTVPFCGIAPLPAELAGRWTLHPGLLGALAILCVALVWATRRSGRAAGFAAVATLAVALVSPLCALSIALFSARSVHHLLLVAVAAPLLALAVPRRRPIPAGMLAGATALQALVLWSWHLPSAYAGALANDAVYLAMEVSLLLSAVLFWRALAAPGAAGLGGVAALMATMGQMGFLGALLTFAPRPLYEAHLLTTAAFGLSPLADQQVAGLLMWVPPVLLYGGAALLIVGRLAAGRGSASLVRA